MIYHLITKLYIVFCIWTLIEFTDIKHMILIDFSSLVCTYFSDRLQVFKIFKHSAIIIDNYEYFWTSNQNLNISKRQLIDLCAWITKILHRLNSISLQGMSVFCVSLVPVIFNQCENNTKLLGEFFKNTYMLSNFHSVMNESLSTVIKSISNAICKCMSRYNKS